MHDNLNKLFSKESSMNPMNQQVGGDHYKKYPIQPLVFAMANNLNPAQTLMLRYLMRYPDKGGAEDLEKLEHLARLTRQIEYGKTDAL
jgi:hypothetical protein